MSASRIYTSPNGPTYILPTALYDYFTSEPGGEPERPLIDWVKENYLHPDWGFVDVGAHVGTYSLHFYPKVREVWAFEPQESTYYRLCGAIALAGHSRLHAVRVALTDPASASMETALLKKQGDEGGLSTIAPDIPHAEDYPRETVPVATLDSYGLDKIGLIKFDVEGSELRALRGARETIQRSGHPRLLVEVWPDAWFADRRALVEKEIQALGYKLEPMLRYPHMLLATHPSSTAKP